MTIEEYFKEKNIDALLLLDERGELTNEQSVQLYILRGYTERSARNIVYKKYIDIKE